MKNIFFIVSVGFALFSMFFGSGNLVFPLTVGMESAGHFELAALGIFLTGVVMPFVGVLAMILFKGDSREFFGVMGKPATFWFPLIALSLMGPFGVLARCITVAHGSFGLLFPEVSLILFSLIFCAVIFLTTLNKTKIVSLLGTVLTPFLLLALTVIVFFGVWHGQPSEVVSGQEWKAFQNGFFQGYQTLDLLAAFFFSTFVIKHLKEGLQGEGENAQGQMLRMFFKAALVGAGLLTLVYGGLVFLGSTYAVDLQDIPPQEMFGTVANKVLGVWSAPIVCLAVVLACFTTAMVLASLFADFLRDEVTDKKMPAGLAMLVTLAIAFSVSTLEFAGIARFLAPILETLYPAMILLTVLNICSKLWNWKARRWPIVLAFVAKFCV